MGSAKHTIDVVGNECGSLARMLSALVGAPADASGLDDLQAALGISTRVVAVPGVCVGRWCGFAEDARLESVADAFGLRLRALHPRSAALGLDDYDAYRQHFVASYVPLIYEALGHDQSVLAWRGWEGTSGDVWGIITDIVDGGLGLMGATPGAERVRLVDPPHQCYVVEQVSPRRSARSELSGLAIAGILDFWERESLPDEGVLFGEGAWDAWVSEIKDGLRCPVCGEGAVGCHARFVGSLRWGRKSAGRFFECGRDDESADSHSIAGSLVRVYSETSEALARISDMSCDDPDAFLRAVEVTRALDGKAIAVVNES